MSKNENVVVKKLELSPKLVSDAKKAYAKQKGLYNSKLDLETIFFRQVLDYAANEYLPKLRKALEQGGFVGNDEPQSRQRPVSPALWESLGEIETEFGVARAQSVRNLLNLLAQDHADDPARGKLDRAKK